MGVDLGLQKDLQQSVEIVLIVDKRCDLKYYDGCNSICKWDYCNRR